VATDPTQAGGSTSTPSGSSSDSSQGTDSTSSGSAADDDSDSDAIFGDWLSHAKPIVAHIGEEVMEGLAQAAKLIIQALDKADHSRLDKLEANQKAYYQVMQQNAANYAASLEALKERV
jgi:hypothetical protein